MSNQREDSRKVRLGVIGAGWWATAAYLPLLAADARVEIAAVNRLGAAELEQVKRKFGAGAAFSDYRQMLASGPLDGVLVTSPHTQHFEHASAALRCGAHVLVEKPMTTTASDARKLVALANEARRQLRPAVCWRECGERCVRPRRGALGGSARCALPLRGERPVREGLRPSGERGAIR